MMDILLGGILEVLGWCYKILFEFKWRNVYLVPIALIFGFIVFSIIYIWSKIDCLIYGDSYEDIMPS